MVRLRVWSPVFARERSGSWIRGLGVIAVRGPSMCGVSLSGMLTRLMTSRSMRC
jgi:hypothetical protein